MNAIEKFRAAMRAAGIEYLGEIVADGKLHRIKAIGDHGSNSWYILYEGQPTAGAFGCWKRGISEPWCFKSRENISATEWQNIRANWKQAEEERQRAEAERQAKARKTAAWILNRSRPARSWNRYLNRKAVKVFGGAREYREALVLPLCDTTGELHSLQFITPNGEKKFLTGGKIARCFYVISDQPTAALVICEGYATGASIHEATGLAVVCALNCSNLKAVAEDQRARWPQREIIIAADNDQWTESNPGLTKAAETAKKIGGRLAGPQFQDLKTKPTDFNDLHQLEGITAVKTQIETAAPQKKITTPAQWYAESYPTLPAAYGAAVLEKTDKEGNLIAKGIGEDFFAATLGEKGNPEAPTVFMPAEEKFLTYQPTEGIFTVQREPALVAQLSQGLLECARVCQDDCDTTKLEFQIRDAAKLGGVINKARGLLAVPLDFFSNDLVKFIPCANGMLELETKKLLPFSPSYRRRNKLPVRFEPAARCPMFLNSLMRPALDDEDLDLVQCWCGLALIGENLAQKIMILTGTAGGGKGTFIRVLMGIIGQINLGSLRTHLLGERFELGRFLGKTLLYGADVPENFLNHHSASTLKSLTGYDPVTLEFKNSNESPSITCRFNVIVTSNSRLTVHLEGDKDAWRRRLIIIEYRKAKPEKVIADLDQQILANEAPGVLNWMLAGLDKIKANGWQLFLNPNQQQRVDGLLLESDGHAVFARECLKLDNEGQLTAADGFEAYVEFCSERGWTALTKNKFGTVICDVVVRQFGITQRHDIRDSNGKTQRGWKGLTIVGINSQPTGKNASEASETQFPDDPDAILPVQPKKNFTDEWI